MSDGLFSLHASAILGVHPVQLFSVVGASRGPSKSEEEQQQQARPSEEHTQICDRGCCIRRSGHSAGGRWGTSSAAQLHCIMGLYHGPQDCSSRCGTPGNVHAAKTRIRHTVVPAQSAVVACVPTGGQHQSVRRQLVQGRAYCEPGRADCCPRTKTDQHRTGIEALASGGSVQASTQTGCSCRCL